MSMLSMSVFSPNLAFPRELKKGLKESTEFPRRE